MSDVVRVDPYWYNENECLGSGAFGEVYKGHNDQNPNQLFAIKRIKVGKMPRNLVEKEIQILQELSDPGAHNAHFVILHDCVQTDKHVYLIMEYCNGGDLDHYLKDKIKLDERSVKIFLQQIAVALNILHKHEIVHRDLKPANILLSHNGTRNISDITFKIADFGLGRFLDQGVQAQTFCGTPVYMAPEIFVPNAKYDYKADLFSIGAIVYQCFTGSLFSAFQKEAPKLPSLTSPELEDLITRLLQREPRDRINFNDFYNHPFIGMKAVEEMNRAKPAAAAARKTPGGANASSAAPASPDPNRLGWFRRTFSFRDKRPSKDDKEKILKDSTESPAQPLSPKKPGGGAQSPAQKNYTGETGTKQPMSPKDKEQSPGQKNAAHARGSTSSDEQTPTKRGFFARWNSPPLNTIQEETSSQLMKTIVVENRDVYGIAHLDIRFYVLCRSQNSLVYFSDQSPFIKIKDFEIEKYVKHPQDIASCQSSKRLYVTDIGNNCIWKIEPGYPFKVSQWASELGSPHTISVSRDGHVITFKSKSLVVYGQDAVVIHQLSLPSEIKSPNHAVANSQGNFIVSYGDANGKKQGVCELTTKGKILRRYEHKTEKLNHPTHLAIDTEDKVFVADNANNRVLLLDKNLKLERVLPSNDKDKLDKPFRLCLTYVKGQKRLLIQHRINAVDIYSLNLS